MIIMEDLCGDDLREEEESRLIQKDDSELAPRDKMTGSGYLFTDRSTVEPSGDDWNAAVAEPSI